MNLGEAYYCSRCMRELEEEGICPYCGTAFIVEKAIHNYNINYNIENAQITVNHNLDKSVRISCPVYQGQLFNNACIAYDKETGEEVVVKGSFGKPSEVMYPGDRFRIGYRGFGKIYLAKVDML